MEEQEKNEFEKIKAEVNAEIEQIRTEYKNAKKILQDITVFGNNFQALKLLLNDENTGVQANYNFTKKQKEQIDAYTIESQNQLGTITANLKKVDDNIKSMQTAYSEFTETKGKIFGISGEIETLLSASRSLHGDITTTKKEALDTLESIKTTFQDLTKNIKDMQDAYQGFLIISSKIDDKKTGLQAILDAAQGLDKQSNALFAEIKTFRDNSKSFLSEIEQNKKQSEALKANIQENFDFTILKKGEIEKATGLIIDTSFADTFKIRQNEIEKELYSRYSWKNIFLVSIAILIILVVLPFIKLLDFGETVWYKLFLIRIFYTSPVLFLIAFSIVQYSKERDLAEKYAFKAASSAAIRSHIDYLIEKFKNDSENKVLDFAKDTFSTIYKEPYETHDGLEKRIKQLEEKQNKDNNNYQISIDETVNKIKELKELIPESSAFEKILNIFIKK